MKVFLTIALIIGISWANHAAEKTIIDFPEITELTADDWLMTYDNGSPTGSKTRRIRASNVRTYMGGSGGGGGSGTVTSVSFTAPDIFTVSGSGGTTAVSLVVAPTDPNADRLVFWDDSAGKWVYLTVGSGLLITGTTITVDIAGLTADGSPDVAADYVMTYDASAGTLKKVLLSNLPGGGGGSVATDSIWDAKGDLAVGTGANTAAKLTVGVNDTLLVADSAEATGLKWFSVTGFETALEGVLDLQDLQGAVTDAQVPNNITVDLATVAATVTVVDGSDATSYPLIADSATGNLPVKTDAALTYDATTGILGATGFSSSGASAGSLDLGDSDGSHFFSIRPNGTTTTSVNFQGPAAPFAGYVQFTVSGTTNWVPSQVAFGTGLLGSDGSNNPVDVDTVGEFSTALGITGTPNSSTFLRGDFTWSTPAGSGDVTKVGTPADNQIGVWTGDGTIEGDSAFTFDTSNDTMYVKSILMGEYIRMTNANLSPNRVLYLDALKDTRTHANVSDTELGYIDGATGQTGTGSITLNNSPTFEDDISLNSAGVRLTGGGSGGGQLTLLGLGAGADEDLTIDLNDTANQIWFSSTTGVTNFVFYLSSVTVLDAAYNATAWNGNNTVPTLNSVRDKIEDIIDGQVWSGTHDFSGATTTAATALSEDNDTSVATTAFVQDARNKSVYVNGTAVAKPNFTNTFHARLVASSATNISITLPAVVANSDAATVTTDASLGTHFRWTATQNFTLGNPTNPTDGQRVLWEIIQDSTGSRTIAFDTKFAFGTDITGVTLTTTANKRDFVTAVYNSTADKWYVVGVSRGY